MATTVLSPMMQQYRDAKDACGDALLLFRMGDFYELFHEDAETAARVLGLTLTSRDKGDNPIPMAGFPHHQLEAYIGKLIRAGYRAAVCEQVEDPKKSKGLVRREVTRVVTAGTVTDDGLLDPRESNYLAAVIADQPPRGKHTACADVGVAWVELSTGRFFAASFSADRLDDELARINPAECLVSDEAPPLPDHVVSDLMITIRSDWVFAFDTAYETLQKQFGTTSIDGFGFDSSDRPAIRAAGAVLDYLKETQKSSLDHIDRIVPYRPGNCLELDEATRRSLEITRTIRDGGREGSLLAMLDRTVTAMGSRLLGQWIGSPLTQATEIDARLDTIGELMGDTVLRHEIRDKLRGVYDLERLLARITTGRASPRDLNFVARTLQNLPSVKELLAASSAELLTRLHHELDLCPDVCDALEKALVEDCPLSAREGSFIRTGFHGQLDELRQLATGGKQWIAQYQAEEVANSGIPMKVGYNKVFGYYIEVTNAHREKVPAHYIRKQTLKNAERFITPELKEYEEKVLSADERAIDLEYELFLELRDLVAAEARRLQATAHVLATLDVLLSLAELAKERDYCRPTINETPILEIIDGRHPVLDVIQPQGTFVPNDTQLNVDGDPIAIITGPNMAGKSTYIRQVALITLMAQTGSYVPAQQATIGIADRIFARVGASDELHRGQSTFMVEMVETARILNTASRNSLVILDEIGRGTSTYDGVSLAWSVVEFLHDVIGCRTMFATHYHELTDLETSLAGVKNLNVSVKEWQDEVVFLHKIVVGMADKSYGIHVARLAGVPREVNQRAQQILALLEEEHLDENGRPKASRQARQRPQGDLQLTLFSAVEHPLMETIRQLDLDSTTPLQAHQLILDWQAELQSDNRH